MLRWKLFLMGSKRSGRQRVRRRLKRFIILCEGQTERLYFQSFRNQAVEVFPRDPSGDRKALLKDALQLAKSEQYDELWLVFDLDYVSAKGIEQFVEFERTIRKAEKAGIQVAWSVDAFELWFCLHYAYTEQRLERSVYYQQLSDHWSVNYSRHGKNKRFASTIRQRLLDDPAASEAKAIEWAKKLMDRFGESPFRERNPVTTVYRLVEALLESSAG